MMEAAPPWVGDTLGDMGLAEYPDFSVELEKFKYSVGTPTTGTVITNWDTTLGTTTVSNGESFTVNFDMKLG